MGFEVETAKQFFRAIDSFKSVESFRKKDSVIGEVTDPRNGRVFDFELVISEAKNVK